jgi:two-component system response regulator YesN
LSFLATNIFRMHSYYYRLFVSYIIVVLILVLAFCAYFNGYSLPNVRQKLESDAFTDLKSAAAAFEAHLEDMDGNSIQMGNNYFFSRHYVQKSNFELSTTTYLMNQYLSGNSFVEDLVLFYPNVPEGFLTLNGWHTQQDFYNFVYRYQRDGFISNEHWQLLNHLSRDLVNPVERINRVATTPANSYTDYMVYYVPIPMNTSTPNIISMFYINRKQFTQVFSVITAKAQGHIFIWDARNNRLLTGFGKKIPDKIEKDIGIYLKQEAGFKKPTAISYNHDSYTLLRTDISNHQLVYFSVLPTHQMLQSLHKTQNLFFLIAGTLLLLGLFYAVMLSHVHYRPLQMMTQKLLPASGARSNEFTLISQAIDRIQAEKEQLSNEVRMQNNLVIERMILSLFIYNYEADDPIWSNLEKNGLRFPYHKYTVVLISIDNINQYVLDSNRKIIDELHKSIIRVAADIIGAEGYCYGTIIPSNANFALLFNMNYAEIEANSRIKDIMEKIQQLYQERLHVSLFVSISKQFSSRIGIRKAYQEAVSGLDYRFLLGNGHIMFAQSPNVPPSVDWYIEGKKADLTIAVNNQDAELVLDISRKIIRHFREHRTDLTSTRAILFDMVIQITFLMNLQMISPGDFGQQSVYERLLALKFSTLDRFEDSYFNFLRKLFEHLRSKSTNASGQWYQELLDYVEMNYCNISLSLDNLSEKFGLSTYYLTRAFKKFKGDSLMRYVDNLRMEKAKSLLATTDFTVKSIAEMVGYSDHNNFSRRFKEHEKMTPLQYRNTMREETNHSKKG